MSDASPRPETLPDIAKPLQPPEHDTESLHSHLCTVPHFCTVPFDELSKLELKTREYSALDSVLEAGSPVQHVYVLVTGAIEVFCVDPKSKDPVGHCEAHHRVGRLTAPSVFGMDSVLLGRNSKYQMRAGTDSQIVLVAKNDFFSLIREHRVFAHSVSCAIVTQLGVFNKFQTLCRSIFAVSASVAEAGTSEAYLLNFAGILQAYSNIPNVMHLGQCSEALDMPAWSYASRRLPQNLVETHVLTLCRSLPPFIAKEIDRQSEEGFGSTRFVSQLGETNKGSEAYVPTVLGHLKLIPTADRRRRSIQVSRGHTMVLLREGFTDILDLVSCLCIHQIEAKKLRVHLQSMVNPTALEILQQGMAEWGNAPERAQKDDVARDTLSQLRLNPMEVEKLYEIWPNSVLHRLTAILTSREEVQVRLDNTLARRFDTDPYLQWALTIRRHLLNALKMQRSSDVIPPDTVIDILCCNTNTPKNLLSSFPRDHKDEILAYGKANKTAVMEAHESGSPWHNEDDLLYYLASNLHGRDVDLTGIKKKTLEKEGFVIIDDTDATGLAVDLIDVDALDGGKVDPILKPAFDRRAVSKKSAGSKARRHFIVNVDYAFGAQADGILRALILTFGNMIRSVNVISKCGGLTGKRGDVVLPERLIFSKEVLGDDTQDEFRFSGNKVLSVDRLNELLGPARRVHTGPVVTIPGLVLQNDRVLKYYHNMWSCDGVEMEASYYARQVEESKQLGLVDPKIETRFGYHVVDLPLAGASQTRVGSKPTIDEVVPGMYALTRAVLEQVVLLPK